MRVSDGWKDYEVLDATDGERLERWGDVILVRPDPQIIWQTGQRHPLWGDPHARYERSSSGGGKWHNVKRFPEKWQIAYRDLRFVVHPTGFKHTGLFPEQACNWDLLKQTIENANRPVSVLNLFAYTGGATLAAAQAGAAVCHVDAAKGMVSWARENAQASQLAQKPIRWIVDDCKKFVEREIKRGTRYDIIIMDPPSYGRGPGGEVWKLEDALYPLVTLCAQVLTDKPLLFLLNSYTTGLSPSVMAYVLDAALRGRFGGGVSADEIGLRVTQSGAVLPCGSTAVWQANR